jgi:hypothetical protein
MSKKTIELNYVVTMDHGELRPARRSYLPLPLQTPTHHMMQSPSTCTSYPFSSIVIIINTVDVSMIVGYPWWWQYWCWCNHCRVSGWVDWDGSVEGQEVDGLERKRKYPRTAPVKEYDHHQILSYDEWRSSSHSHSSSSDTKWSTSDQVQWSWSIWEHDHTIKVL